MSLTSTILQALILCFIKFIKAGMVEGALPRATSVAAPITEVAAEETKNPIQCEEGVKTRTSTVSLSTVSDDVPQAQKRNSKLTPIHSNKVWSSKDDL